jgi:hypothetical protein
MKKDNAQNKTSNQSNKPTHTVYVVKNHNDKDIWTKVGVAFEHKDGNGMNQILNLFDLGITLTIRKNKDKAA